MAFKTLFLSLSLTALMASPAFAQGKQQEPEHLPLPGTEKMVPTGDTSHANKAPEVVKVPPASIPADPQNIWDLDLSDGGRVRIQLRPDVAPNSVERIKTLTRQGFYNGLKFHRVIDGFMAQGGDPKGDGTGGSTMPDVKAEFNALPHVRGAVAMARANDPDSANSQFFIMFLPRMQLDGKYTIFGRVIEGMQYVDAITRGEPPANPTVILQASIDADGKAPPAQLPAAGVKPASQITPADLSAPIKN